MKDKYSRWKKYDCCTECDAIIGIDGYLTDTCGKCGNHKPHFMEHVSYPRVGRTVYTPPEKWWKIRGSSTIEWKDK